VYHSFGDFVDSVVSARGTIKPTPTAAQSRANATPAPGPEVGTRLVS
jgi:hypothetical protein